MKVCWAQVGHGGPPGPPPPTHTHTHNPPSPPPPFPTHTHTHTHTHTQSQTTWGWMGVVVVESRGWWEGREAEETRGVGAVGGKRQEGRGEGKETCAHHAELIMPACSVVSALPPQPPGQSHAGPRHATPRHDGPGAHTHRPPWASVPGDAADKHSVPPTRKVLKPCAERSPGPQPQGPTATQPRVAPRQGVKPSPRGQALGRVEAEGK